MQRISYEKIMYEVSILKLIDTEAKPRCLSISFKIDTEYIIFSYEFL